MFWPKMAICLKMLLSIGKSCFTRVTPIFQQKIVKTNENSDRNVDPWSDFNIEKNWS
jgi:hypothetical protein